MEDPMFQAHRRDHRRFLSLEHWVWVLRRLRKAESAEKQREPGAAPPRFWAGPERLEVCPLGLDSLHVLFLTHRMASLPCTSDWGQGKSVGCAGSLTSCAALAGARACIGWDMVAAPSLMSWAVLGGAHPSGSQWLPFSQGRDWAPSYHLWPCHPWPLRPLRWGLGRHGAGAGRGQGRPVSSCAGPAQPPHPPQHVVDH